MKEKVKIKTTYCIYNHHCTLVVDREHYCILRQIDNCNNIYIVDKHTQEVLDEFSEEL